MIYEKLQDGSRQPFDIHKLKHHIHEKTLFRGFMKAAIMVGGKNGMSSFTFVLHVFLAPFWKVGSPSMPPDYWSLDGQVPPGPPATTPLNEKLSFTVD